MLQRLIRNKNMIVAMSIQPPSGYFILADQHNIKEQSKFPLHELQNLIVQIKQAHYSIQWYLAIPHRFMMMKRLRFTHIFKKKELRELLYHNAEDYFGCPLSELYFDFECLANDESSVRIVAGKKSVLCEWLTVFEANDISLKLLSSDAIAIEQLLLHEKMLHPEKIYAVFVVVDEILLAFIVVAGVVCFADYSTVNSQTAVQYQLEIIKFLRRYEASKLFINSVSEMIFLGIDAQIFHALKVATKYNYVTVPQAMYSSPYLVSMGLLRC